MLLAGDIGGTKTLLGLFSRAPSRPAPLNVQSFPTADYGSLVEMVDAFLMRQPGGRPIIDAAAFGVAGPVIDDRAELTNVGWVVDGREVGHRVRPRLGAPAERPGSDRALDLGAAAG